MAYFRKAKGPAWLHPMVCVAARTAMRQSELIRPEARGVSFAGVVTTVPAPVAEDAAERDQARVRVGSSPSRW